MPTYRQTVEEIVTSTTIYVGKKGNLLEEKPENCRVLKIENPILTSTDMLKIKNMKNDGVLTASVVVTTTLLAAFTLTLWIFLLRTFGII